MDNIADYVNNVWHFESVRRCGILVVGRIFNRLPII